MQRQVEPLSFQDFIAWEQTQSSKHELLNGHIVAFAGGTFDHHEIAANVLLWLRARLDQTCRAVGSDAIIETVSRKTHSGLRPDVVVTCSERDFGRATYVSTPRIIVEVRSPANTGAQWDAKLFQYWNTPCIEQVIVVESDERLVESYARRDDGTWNEVEATTTTGSVAFGGIAELMTLDEIYRRTSFDGRVTT